MIEIKVIQFLHIMIKRFVNREIQQVPVLLPLFIPFPELPDFIAHEIQLFTRMQHHIGVHGACLWEFPFVIAVHLLQNRRLSMHYLIVGKRQQIMLVIRIHH